ncbi:MAG: exonuclease domain-containing protein [Acidimicrobiaceae bacterium]|nr:exonuclease domain-containing protein [Acidimicrobiaceae bacterium]
MPRRNQATPGLGGGKRFAVVDTETTGFSRRDRIVEFACVTISEGQVVDEYESLLQPDRDPGPVHVHGITPTMLESAPAFEAVAGDIAARLDGAVLVAHNISFDLRMLSQEVERVRGMSLDVGAGVCTYRLTGQKLAVAAERFGLSPPDHSALTDARVAAELLLIHADAAALAGASQASCRASGKSGGLTVRRPGAPPRRGALSVLAARTSWPSSLRESEALYLDALDRCLDDGELSEYERSWLSITASVLHIGDQDRELLHRRYFDLLVERILADGIVSEQERWLHAQVAAALEINAEELRDDASSRVPPGPGSDILFEPAAKVCFTGSAVVDGRPVARSELERVARAAGLEVVGTVTKRCGLVVAADRMSRSGKARRARELGIRVVSAADFVELVSRRR